MHAAECIFFVHLKSRLALLSQFVLHHVPLLLGLHPAVLEPDFDLPLREAEVEGEADPLGTREIALLFELLLELVHLGSAECDAGLLQSYLRQVGVSGNEAGKVGPGRGRRSLRHLVQQVLLVLVHHQRLGRWRARRR